MTVKEEIALRLKGVTSAEILDLKKREKLELEQPEEIPEEKPEETPEEKPEEKTEEVKQESVNTEEEKDPRDDKIKELEKQIADLQKRNINKDVSKLKEEINPFDYGVNIVKAFLN